jgi:hypothetical protein
MRNLICRAVSSVALALCLTTATGAGAAWAARSAHWQVYFTSPHGPTYMYGVASRGPKNAWAVGNDGSGLYAVHWNGYRWQHVNVPVGRGFDASGGIQATAADNVWILGTTRTDQPSALIWNGFSWHLVSLPTTFAAVLSSSDVWGLDNGGSCTGGTQHPVCTSTVWHWHDGSTTTYQIPGATAAVAGAGRHVWILAQVAIRNLDRPQMSSLAAIYSGDAKGLHRVTAPSGRMSADPNLAAAPGGQLWLLAPGLHSSGAVDYWNGRSWARHRIPTATDIYFSQSEFTFDDHHGVWLGPYVHWTGSRWISTSPHGPTQAYALISVAPIPGLASAWAVGANGARPGTRAYRGLIALYGARP